MQVIQKLDQCTYDRIRVTSDTHFGHNKDFIYSKRGYSSVDEMNSDMIQIINDNVKEGDILLHLGDFCLNSSQEEYQKILAQLSVKEIWMLWGNHNSPILKEYHQVSAFNQGVFIRYLNHYYTFSRGNKRFVCFHYPISSWDGEHTGSMHLCGHSHGRFIPSKLDNTEKKILDCGWDVHHRPITMQEIENIMTSKNINSHTSIQ